MIPAVVLLLWIALPVQARSDEKTACPGGSGCVWDHTDFRGARTQVPSAGCIDSRIRSAANNSDEIMQFFMGGGCTGPVAATLQPGQDAPEIGAGSASRGCSASAADSCGGGVGAG
ncbi:MAG: peptidase inhibitor family I36 protein [Actinobacteria bacterium]|nr:peptidase inhibitor family I36 protein [Actinomycetota bacterium]